MKRMKPIWLIVATATLAVAVGLLTWFQGGSDPAVDPTKDVTVDVITVPDQTTQTTQATQPTTLPDPSVTTTAPVVDGDGILPMTYPETDVKTLSERMISLGSFSARAAGESNYKGNRHYTGTNLVISPHFAAQIQGEKWPVYATPVFVATDAHGAIHSYASADVDFSIHEQISVQINVEADIDVLSVQVYAQDAVKVECTGKSVNLQLSSCGVYTVVLNDDQDYSVTLFVRQYRNEDAEIAAFRAQYGEDHVLVYEPGIHEIDHLQLRGDTVLYLKSGAILLPKHTFDIMDDTAASNTEELGAKRDNGIGLNRYPVVNAYNCSNVIIAGRGTVDMTQLDWHERRGIVFTQCSSISMDGVIIVNPCEWAFITYRCENVRVTQSAVLGYRTNSDAFAICNSIDVQITDCFARTGDDMFEVKTLGGVDTAVSRDITFSRCQAWGSKARCFGVIGEIEKDISNILFEDGIVIFRDATWDNNRIGSLVVLRECGNGKVSGVTFRNMTIHYDRGRAINVGVYSSGLSNSIMENIIFENITYTAKMNSQLRLNSGSGNVLQVILKNVTANGTLLNRKNAIDYIYWDQEGLIDWS